MMRPFYAADADINDVRGQGRAITMGGKQAQLWALNLRILGSGATDDVRNDDTLERVAALNGEVGAISAADESDLIGTLSPRQHRLH